MPSRIHYRQDKANLIIKFCETHLIHSRERFAGKPFILADWQKDYLSKLIGTYDDDRRAIRESLLFLPRGSGKSFLASSIALYFLFVDTSPKSEIYVVASSVEQASRLFDYARSSVEQNPLLKDNCIIYKTSILTPANGSIFKVLSSVGDTSRSSRCRIMIMDEVQAQKNRDLYDAVKNSQDTYGEPLRILIGTAGNDKTSLAYEKFEYAKKVKSGQIEDHTFLPCLYYAEPQSELNIETYIKCNPNYGISIDEQSAKLSIERAKQNVNEEIGFRRDFYNEWVLGHSGSFFNMNNWEKCYCKEFPDLTNVPIFLAYDGALRRDLSCISACSYLDGKFYFRLYTLCPTENIDFKTKHETMKYREWERQGWMKETPGDCIEQTIIADFISKLPYKKIKALLYDKAYSSIVVERLHTKLRCIPFPQYHSAFNEPVLNFKEAIDNQTIQHDGNPILTWCCANSVCDMDAKGHVMIHKGRSVDKVDGAVASIMAFAIAQKEGMKKSINDIMKERMGNKV